MAQRRVTICRNDSKRCFPTERDAWKQVSLMRVAGLVEARLLRPYRCAVHRAWHVGRLD
jgi:hypothetical protein